MRTRHAVTLALAAFAFGAALAALLMQRPPPDPATRPANRAVLYWYDPMAPQQHFDAPGKSPYMNMDLVPRYAGDASDPTARSGAAAGTVRIDPGVIQRLGVRTARAERGTVARPLRATGTIAFDERAVSVVQSRVAGIVVRLWVRAPLSEVARGDPLVTLIAPDWTAAQEEYLALRTAKAPGLDALRDAARRRLALLGMDEARIRAVERGGAAQAQITIAAPRDGVVTELAVRDGASVMAGAALATVSGIDSVWVNAAIGADDSGRVAPGARAVVTVDAFPDERFAASVEALLPNVDAVTRTQAARIVLPNPQRRLAAGMFARVEIEPAATSAASVLVPSEAVIATGARSVVIVDAGDGRFRAQEVRVGAEGGGKTAVLDGVREGDSVVLSGQFLIDSEASLSGALARLGAPAPARDDATTPAASRP
jgi:Cu(I)/Ag(I) efflux system membrane fusion protein